MTRTWHRLEAARSAVRLFLGAGLTFAGITHLTTQRKEFQAQVPPWIPLDPDDVVVMSGMAEIGLGVALTALSKEKQKIGWLTATFFTAIFPGNIAQFTEKRDAFGLDTDRKRALRLLSQPILVALALWSTRKPSSRYFGGVPTR